jgi:ANTAR domain/GAF domain
MSSTPQPAVRTALLEPTPSLSSIVDLPSVLDSIVHAVSQLGPGIHVGVSVTNSTGTFETLAGTDPLVFVLDDLQYDLDEGPCLTAIREDHTVIVEDAESEHRWPRFMPRAIDMGLRSHLGLPIPIDAKTLAGLNVYSTTHSPLDAGRLDHAKLFAAHAGMAMRHSVRENDLVLALQSSRTIGKAIGLVMEWFDLDDQEAFEYLVRLSQKANLKLRDVAAHLVKQSNDLRHCRSATHPPLKQHSPESAHASLLPFSSTPEPASWAAVDEVPQRHPQGPN